MLRLPRRAASCRLCGRGQGSATAWRDTLCTGCSVGRLACRQHRAVTSCSVLITDVNRQLLSSRHMQTCAALKYAAFWGFSRKISYKAVCPVFFERERLLIMHSMLLYATPHVLG